VLELQLTDYDHACMRKWRITPALDLRTRKEAEERFSIPEWIRRTQWRHFWSDHDSVYAASRLAPAMAGSMEHSRRVSGVSSGGNHLPTRGVSSGRLEFDADNSAPVMVAIVVAFVIVTCSLLGLYAFSLK
jgi:hypothetical protein